MFNLQCICIPGSEYTFKHVNTFFYIIYRQFDLSGDKCDRDFHNSHTYFLNYCKCVKNNSNVLLRSCHDCTSKYSTHYGSNNVILHTMRNLFIEYISTYNYKHTTYNAYIVLKYKFLKKMVIDNKFYTDNLLEEFLELFSSIQKSYTCLSRFACFCKRKKAKLLCSTDLFLNELIPQKGNVIEITQDNKLFYFSVQDMLNICLRSLCKTDKFFNLLTEEPCNPYTKNKFELHHLYNLYFRVKLCTSIIIPHVFEYWFLNNFCYNKMIVAYEYLMKQYAIRTYVWNASINDTSMITHIYEMIDEYPNIRRKLKICEKFPNKYLVNCFRSYVYVYYLMEYGELNEYRYRYYNGLLKTSLINLIELYPLFGREKEPKVIKSFKKDEIIRQFYHEYVPLDSRYFK